MCGAQEIMLRVPLIGHRHVWRTGDYAVCSTDPGVAEEITLHATDPCAAHEIALYVLLPHAPHMG